MYKERINELHTALADGEGTIVSLSGSPPEYVVLCGKEVLDLDRLPHKREIGAYTWENRKSRAFLRPNAVLWSAKVEGRYLVGVGAAVDVQTAARAALMFPDRVVRLG